MRPTKPPRFGPDEGLDDLLAWCRATTDLASFKTVLRRFPAEGWSEFARSLGEILSRPDDQASLPAEHLMAARDRRARARTQLLKQDLLDTEDAVRRRRPPAPTPDQAADETA